MGLVSSLFKDNAQLAACQTSDVAHLTLRAQGEHVSRVQLALSAVDCLHIARCEMVTQTYGPSTAKAVLAYKTKRSIINKARQSAPDAVVGKMTITRLDQDIANWERSRRTPGDCSCARPTLGASAHLNAFAAKAAAKRQFGKTLRICLAITRTAVDEGGFDIGSQINVAKDLLGEYGLQLSVEFNSRFADNLAYSGAIVMQDDATILRNLWDITRPGFADILRVMVCPLPHGSPDFGETLKGHAIANKMFKPFIVLNSRKNSTSGTTLLHEMIHCSLAASEHDAEPYSLFNEITLNKPGDVRQMWLKPERAASLASSFFAV